ncbi:methyltransferase domain-containing protein [Streptomyces sp. NPDC001135]
MPVHEIAAESLVDSFMQAPDGALHNEFQRLALSLWSESGPSGQAEAAVAEILAVLATAPGRRRAHLALTLGLLADVRGGGTAVRARVRSGLHDYLDLLGRADGDVALQAVVVHLLAQFPEDRSLILQHPAMAALGEDDLSRLERCLAPLDPGAPAIGRAWPSPARWTLDAAELDRERRWTRTLAPARIAAMWDKDTRTLLAYLGARAVGAVTFGLGGRSLPVDAGAHGAAEFAGRPAPDALRGPHAEAIRCPRCRGRLAEEATGASCTGCGARYAGDRGYLDLSGEDPDAADQIAGNSPLYLHRYETLLRPAFLRVHGANWNGPITPHDEDRYLQEQVRPAAGPVVDLAAGAGRWTRTLADRVGSDRVIAVDLAADMVRKLRTTLPGVLSVRGSAGRLPFADASLGAVNCWNALQSMDEPYGVVQEVGRCLRPGGTFTLLTYRTAADPVYRHFQRRHEECLGVRSFDTVEMRGALASAGLEIRDETTPGTFLLITAVRNGK